MPNWTIVDHRYAHGARLRDAARQGAQQPGCRAQTAYHGTSLADPAFIWNNDGLRKLKLGPSSADNALRRLL
eukprot:5026141-Pyramimonas_sp.AAC.1